MSWTALGICNTKNCHRPGVGLPSLPAFSRDLAGFRHPKDCTTVHWIVWVPLCK